MESSRIARALSERIYLLDFILLGNYLNEGLHGRVQGMSGKEYDCEVRNKSSYCSCPDFLQRGRSLDKPCKHLYFLLSRVGKSMEDSENISKSIRRFTLSPKVIKNFQNLLDVRNNSIKTEEQEERQQERQEDTNCSICFEEIIKNETYANCLQCQKRIHGNCFHHWKTTCHKNGKKPTCPLCRSSNIINFYDEQITPNNDDCLNKLNY